VEQLEELLVGVLKRRVRASASRCTKRGDLSCAACVEQAREGKEVGRFVARASAWVHGDQATATVTAARRTGGAGGQLKSGDIAPVAHVVGVRRHAFRVVVAPRHVRLDQALAVPNSEQLDKPLRRPVQWPEEWILCGRSATESMRGCGDMDLRRCGREHFARVAHFAQSFDDRGIRHVLIRSSEATRLLSSLASLKTVRHLTQQQLT
jgi:hypothetical protein